MNFTTGNNFMPLTSVNQQFDGSHYPAPLPISDLFVIVGASTIQGVSTIQDNSNQVFA